MWSFKTVNNYFKKTNMVEQQNLLDEIKKLEASARQYQQEVPLHFTLTLFRANTLKQSVSLRSSWRLKRCISELTRRSSLAHANSYVKSVTFLPSITWRRRMSTQLSTCSRSQRSFARITSSDKQWLSIIWRATTAVLERCDQLSISCSKR